MIDIITFILILQILMIILHLINAKKFSNIYHNVNMAAMNSMISSQNSAKDMIMSEAIIEIMKMKEEVRGDEMKGDEMKGDEVRGEEVRGDEMKGEEVKGDEMKGDEMKGDEVKDYETKTIDKFLNPSTREIIMEEAAHDAKVCEMNVKSLK